MTEKEILNFKDSIKNFNVEELMNEKKNLDDKITKMILDSDLMLKVAIVAAKLKEKGIDCLPGTLEEAIKAAEDDPFIKETLGEHVFNNYIGGKREEWESYRTYVSQWEIDRYMINY